MALPVNIIFLLTLGFTGLLVSGFLFFSYRKPNWALCILMLGSFLVGCAFALLDPFLNLWDEQFHALVAKNLMNDPLHPTLYDADVLSLAQLDWTSSHTWLHKQPLFLWQMALSMKLFGVSVFWMRFPGVVMHTLITLFIFRIGKISTGEKVGFMASAFFAFAHFPLELVAGLYHTDHNDIAFLFYVTATFWAWFEYQQSHNRWWLPVIGILAGAAVLVKWLTGMLVYAGWAMVITATRKWKEYKYMAISVITTIAVFLPWQLYILWQFPKEAAYEYRLNSIHFFEVVESHSGGWFFHWNAMEKLYGSGDAVPYIMLAALILWITRLEDLRHRLFIAVSVLAVYVFFTLAATKMHAYTLVVSPFFFLGLAYLVHFLFDWLHNRFKKVSWLNFLQVILLSVVCWGLFDFNRVQRQHTLKDPAHNNGRDGNLRELSFIQSISLPEPDERYVVFNANLTPFGAIPFMFHRDFAAAYTFPPTDEHTNTVLAKGYKPIVVYWHEGEDLPHFKIMDTLQPDL